ncbi:hypothetical protein KMAL_29590 [Novacetimonas maltaceti]|uniref:Uncharacterized protein n=1 Tax=Novacetimonas maltaceti TaxID=1203393 RepID=A0A2S3VXS1_9PROT|nr:hypothetical protein KMAL_29590 [Novacetimonas maltaceti]
MLCGSSRSLRVDDVTPLSNILPASLTHRFKYAAEDFWS